ncbi:MAG TPA: ASCH domain-containing protein [Burkholderiaceae bacterium]|jgi:uncharacterized protein YhfF|nr:ASCH domain-containing protein [Burkholderiaceae bacterium]
MPESALPANIAAFWNAFIASRESHTTYALREVFHFCDNENDANTLADLVMIGTKRATASSLWSYEWEKFSLPKIGDVNIVTKWDGTPCCVIETIAVNTVPFDQVTAEFAATEGEGDKSLTYWRDEHRAYFTRECKEYGTVPTLQMPIVCEEFKVIYRALD